jgi:hypothetical protein
LGEIKVRSIAVDGSRHPEGGSASANVAELRLIVESVRGKMALAVVTLIDRGPPRRGGGGITSTLRDGQRRRRRRRMKRRRVGRNKVWR